MRESLQHRGIVESVEGRVVTVSVDRESACDGCHAKGICSSSGEKRLIAVETEYAATFERSFLPFISARGLVYGGLAK